MGSHSLVGEAGTLRVVEGDRPVEAGSQHRDRLAEEGRNSRTRRSIGEGDSLEVEVADNVAEGDSLDYNHSVVVEEEDSLDYNHIVVVEAEDCYVGAQ